MAKNLPRGDIPGNGRTQFATLLLNVKRTMASLHILFSRLSFSLQFYLVACLLVCNLIRLHCN